MPQHNMHTDLNDFYSNHVRLKDEIKHLRGLRDTNLNRLKDGLKSLGKPVFVKSLEQGSIPMHTANKAPNNDYDIDIAVIFEKDDLPSSPLEARKRVANAINEKANGFSREPEARTNAVTVWYADGYHVDIAVYRRSEDFWGTEILEHAGAEWSERDPKAITDWFIAEIKNQSPSENTWLKPKVDSGQMRRIIRWIKCFSKGREGWNLPGGLIISTLVTECYKPNNDRDDVALYDTLKSIKNRLSISCSVYNPVDSSQELTQKQQFSTQVKNLKKRLGSVIKKMDVLFDDDCTDAKAKKAYNYMFQHEYWNFDNSKASSKSLEHNDGYSVSLKMGSARTSGGILTAHNISSGRILPKRVHLKFEATTNVPSPFSIRWNVINTGVEAEAINDMGHSSVSTNSTQWERTSYRGNHHMLCEIIKNHEVVASSKFNVNIR